MGGLTMAKAVLISIRPEDTQGRKYDDKENS